MVCSGAAWVLSDEAGPREERHEEFAKVNGCDVVTEPATVAGLFESIQNGGKKMKKTFKEVTDESIVAAHRAIFGSPLGPAPKPGETFKEVTPDSILEDRQKLFV